MVSHSRRFGRRGEGGVDGSGAVLASERRAFPPPGAGPARRRQDGAPIRLVFLFLGRNGGLGQFLAELASAAGDCPHVKATFGVARASGIAGRLARSGACYFELDACGKWPVPELIVNFPAARRALLAHLARERPDAVVTLMPHVWTPLLAPSIKRRGALYVTIAHDVVAHPGDSTGFATSWLLCDTDHADLVVTLSRTVADRLVASRHVPPARVVPLFHPDLHYSGAVGARERQGGRPLRLLFFGRILKYKGLSLLTDAVARLRAEGVAITLGVVGAGRLGDQRDKLAALQAEVINRWIPDQEVPQLFARYDAVALPYLEASQSGVAAAAFGHRMPVVAMPVGGLAEQVADGRTGILAHGRSAASLAESIGKLAHDVSLHNTISRELVATAAARSMPRFLRELTGAIAGCLAAESGGAHAALP